MSMLKTQAYQAELSLIYTTLDSIFKNPPSSAYLTLFETGRYSTLAPSKQVRPLLTLLLGKHLKVPLEHLIQAACTVEIVHTYSLIHDDLPCMDDDDMRRNKPSLHKAYDESTAVLTGDFLLTLSFGLLSHAPHIEASTKLS